jgi:hypothetical protein
VTAASALQDVLRHNVGYMQLLRDDVNLAVDFERRIEQDSCLE